MSTTNDPHDHREPNEPSDITDMDAGDDHAGDAVATPDHREAIRQGHEPDEISVKPILVTGAVLVVVCVIAYVVVTFVFGFIPSQHRQIGPDANTLAAERGEAPVNERIRDLRESEGQQPPLEGMVKLQQSDDPTYLGGAFVDEDRSSPRYHPESIRAANYRPLQEYRWANKSKGSVRPPIAEAMTAVLDGDTLTIQEAEEEE